jgi:hypothetical protein
MTLADHLFPPFFCNETRTMRLNTPYIELVRNNIYSAGEPGDRILAAVTACRRANGLDDKFPAGNPWDHDDETLRYEVEKLAVVFEAMRRQPSPEARLDTMATLKQYYPAGEVDEIVEEYELL